MAEQNKNGSRIGRKVAMLFLIFPTIMHVVIYSVYLVSGTLVFDDLAYSELTWAELTASYPHLAYVVSEYIRMMGIAIILLEMFVLFGIYLIFRKSSKPAWVFTMAGSSIPVIMELALTYPIIGISIPYLMYIMLATMVGLGIGIAGMGLFGKENEKNLAIKREGAGR